MLKRIALVFVMAVCITGTYADTINLCNSNIFLREGFLLEWVFEAPWPGDANWTNIYASNRPQFLRIYDFVPRESALKQLFSFKKESSKRYCIMIPFSANDTLLASRTGIGLYLAEIGQNWQIYLNGYLVRDENHAGSSGKIYTNRSVEGALIELDTRYLNKGKNFLSIMIMGEPSAATTGLTAKGPYLIDEYGKLSGYKRETLKLILIGIYFFFALYHTVLYILSPKTKAYLYFGISTGILSVFLFARTFIVYDIISDTHIVASLELASLFALVPAFIAFFDASLGKSLSLFGKVYAGLSLLIAVLQFFFWQELFMRMWQFTVAVPVMYIVIIDIGIPLIKTARAQKNSSITSLVKRITQVLIYTDESRLLVAIALMVLAVALDLSKAGAANAVSYSDYAYLLLVFGTGAALASQIVRAFNESETLGIKLGERVKVRQDELEKTLADQASLHANLSATRTKLEAGVSAAVKDMQIATRMQQSFFPSSAPHTASWDAAFVFMPASGVSGDFYDFYLSGSSFEGLAVGDVSGHGIAPGLVTVLARSIFSRNFISGKTSPLGAVMDSINAELIPELVSIDNFLTAVLLRLTDSGIVEYTSAAHAEVIYKSANRLHAIPLKPAKGKEYKGPPLGREGFAEPYSSMRFKLEKGDALLIHTDGLDEAKNVDGMQFGINGIASALSSAPEGDATQVLDYIIREWRFHTSGTKIADDVTAVLLKKM